MKLRWLAVILLAPVWTPLAVGYHHAWNHYRAERARSLQFYAESAMLPKCDAACLAEHDRDWLDEHPPPGVVRRNGW